MRTAHGCWVDQDDMERIPHDPNDEDGNNQPRQAQANIEGLPDTCGTGTREKQDALGLWPGRLADSSMAGSMSDDGQWDLPDGAKRRGKTPSTDLRSTAVD